VYTKKKKEFNGILQTLRQYPKAESIKNESAAVQIREEINVTSPLLSESLLLRSLGTVSLKRKQ
jgi:hypothetical protein